jgi:hypothetical protein
LFHGRHLQSPWDDEDEGGTVTRFAAQTAAQQDLKTFVFGYCFMSHLLSLSSSYFFPLRFAEMDAGTKNQISHRSKALAMLKEYLEKHPDALAE